MIFLRLVPLAVLALGAAGSPPTAVPEQRAVSPQDEELEQLLAEERAEADRLRRRGAVREAQRILDEHLAEDEGDAASRVLRARLFLDEGRYAEALADARRALEDERGQNAATSARTRAQAARAAADVLLELGRADEALTVLRSLGGEIDPTTSSEDAWTLGRALVAAGERAAGREAWRRAVERRASAGEGRADWRELLARARCERALGMLVRASRTLVAADAAAKRGEGAEADVLCELGEIYFEADREVADAAHRSPKELFDAALALTDGRHARASRGVFELHRTNWRRQSRPATDVLADALREHPRSLDLLVAGAEADLDDGKLVAVRATLAHLREIAPARRDVRALEAALAWVEHRREEAEGILAELAAADPADGVPTREVGRHLLELYRFAEGVEFLARSVAVDAQDHVAWTHYGRALANVGREEQAREALARAETLAEGRQDAWRANTAAVLEKMDAELVREESDDLAFRWQAQAAGVLRAYLFPFYAAAREEFAARYGYTAPPTLIEVFDEHADFSVRSTGFEGFPGLGVCFGPVVTAVSPQSELRGTFSWARTAFHEFSHVVHLGLSHNRCPRWITEGLATWEETNKNPSWTRNMRRDLLDALANDDLLPVRELNRAFRGPRILFGYYQGGLLCEMWIERHGFPPLVELLRAFDRGADVDQALAEVFGTTPEETDRAFRAWVQERYGALALEPRWRADVAARLRLTLPREAPAEEEARAEWSAGWLTVAWQAWQQGRKVDAQEALRVLAAGGVDEPRARFLRAEIHLREGERERAAEEFRAGIAAGGESFTARMALGRFALEAEDEDEALRQFRAAEAAFPGFDDAQHSAELALAALHEARGERAEEMAARERWLAWNASDIVMRRRVATWHEDEGRAAEAARLLAEVNEVDPFLRAVHERWGALLEELGDLQGALREYEVALAVPPELDGDGSGPLSAQQRAALLGAQAELLQRLGRDAPALERAREALALDEDEARALRVLEAAR